VFSHYEHAYVKSEHHRAEVRCNQFLTKIDDQVPYLQKIDNRVEKYAAQVEYFYNFVITEFITEVVPKSETLIHLR
jgi:hydrogenase maturation factor HypF (carbamoyltransferase family)